MNAHDVDMASLGAGAAEILMLGTWWIAGIPQRRKARERAAERLAEAEEFRARIQAMDDQLDRTAAKLRDGRP